MKTRLAALGAVIALGFATPAQADILTYDVTDATSGSCPHGVWTNTLSSGCDQKFSFQDGTTFSVDTDAGTGTFSGTAINQSGETLTFDLTLSGLLDTLDGTGFAYKGNGGPYDPANQDYFTSIAGTFGLTSPGRDDGPFPFRIDDSDPMAGNTVFQFGVGANDKTGDFGGSSWLNILNPNFDRMPHWDLNFDLALRPGTPVPAPAGILLFGLGLAGAWSMRRRKQAAA